MTVYTYPEGEYLGSLGGFSRPDGECVDKNGDVFITDFGGGDIRAYAHGGAHPIATLKDDAEDPSGCSVDPVGGSVAVANYYTTLYERGSLSIYPHEGANDWGSPQRYTDANFFHMDYCGYDGRGDLFVDGESSQGQFEFAELPAGRKTFTGIKLKQSIEAAGAVQWDGTDVAVGDSGSSPSMIYQFHIHANVGTKVGATALDGTPSVLQFWIAGSTALGAVPSASTIAFWMYPAGGDPRRAILQNVNKARGVAISPSK